VLISSDTPDSGTGYHNTYCPSPTCGKILPDAGDHRRKDHAVSHSSQNTLGEDELVVFAAEAGRQDGED
jgi:hypothetical protein